MHLFVGFFIDGSGKDRTITHFDWISAARDFDDRGWALVIGKVFGKALRIDRGGGDDQFQVRALARELTQIAEQEVDVQRAFVSFVDDDRVVLIEEAIALRLSE